MVVDLFAGGGGASTGIEKAINRSVDIAINHDPRAIAMHAANHPETRHYQEDIWSVDPREACGSKSVALLWASPDCTHFSRAKGGQPRKKEIRSLAWVVIRWIEAVRPRVICIENVTEFETWGPLDDEGRPIKEQIGSDFRAWIGRMSDLGYKVEYRSMVAADYGAPTTRNRLFIVARCDGQPIVWPEPTHGKGRSKAWRPASEVINWNIPCTSIFERSRPLADATLKRIAKGLDRYVFGAKQPFIIPLTHQGEPRAYGIDDPMRTVTAANRGELAFVAPFIAKHFGGPRGTSGADARTPIGTITTVDHHAIVAPFIVRHGHYSTITGAGIDEGCGAGTFRGQPLESPLATVCATNDKHIVMPFVMKHFGGGDNGKPPPGLDINEPLGAVTETDHHGLAAAFLTKFYGQGTGATVDHPLPTIVGCGHIAEVRAFLKKHAENRRQANVQLTFGSDASGDKSRDMGRISIKGQLYDIVDIGMRMLDPSELFAAQGFPSDYNISPIYNGKPLTKTAQTALAGNSVCPPIAERVVFAQMFQSA
jgi:DNA (cytosine-5)-methyltransferase 1